MQANLVGSTNRSAQGVPCFSPLLCRLVPERCQKELLDVNQTTLSWRYACAELVGRVVHALGECHGVGLQFGFEPFFDTIIDDEMQRACTNTQNQAGKLWRDLVRRSCPPAIILGSELGRVEGTWETGQQVRYIGDVNRDRDVLVMVVGTVEPIVDKAIGVGLCRHGLKGSLEFFGRLSFILDNIFTWLLNGQSVSQSPARTERGKKLLTLGPLPLPRTR